MARSAQNEAIYQAFMADPTLHLRADLGPHYRCGQLGIRKPTDPKHLAVWGAGRDSKALTPAPSPDKLEEETSQ